MYAPAPRVRRSSFLLAAVLILFLGETAAGQAVNRDVPYVPTPREVVDTMLEMAEAGPGDALYDLGCGDGRIVIRALTEFDVQKAVGVDIDPVRIMESHENAMEAGVRHRATFVQADLFEVDFSDASVVTLYLLPEVNMKLRPALLETLEPGTRVVSHMFDMDDWEPDGYASVGRHEIFLWVIPARLEGTWSGETDEDLPVRLHLSQEFQRIEGRVRIGGADMEVHEAKVKGSEVEIDARRVGTSGPRTVRLEADASGDKVRGSLEMDGAPRKITLVRRR